ncbi:MAG: hemerythrin family protein [Chromatiaceae bacterium]|jgi:hemerythrin|nr:hemerythrin family protein [Chromatiaceae bacterium]
MNLEPINVGYDAADDPGSFDGAHRELFDLYNRIVWACHHEAAVVPIRERIRTFLMYATWHFSHEEEWMRELHYPDRARHKADHDRLQQDAEDFVESLGGALELADMPAIARYFNHWLARHTAQHDEPLRAFMSQARSGR